MRSTMRLVIAFSLTIMGCSLPVQASFHLMQIEQVIAGVNGDMTAQAIQLRMRNVGQNFVSQARIRAWDANGANPIVIHNLATNVAMGGTGSRVLLCTASFAAATSPPCTPDFIISTPIPASYLAAGKLTFEADFGTIYWAVAWGAYTGTNTGNIANDADGQFSPAFPQPLPSAGSSALNFPGLATAPSTNNAADYIITAGTSVWVNNSGSSFQLGTVTPNGRCCLAGGMCQVTTQVLCMGMAGTWTEGGACDVGACVSDPEGACCVGSVCTITTLSECGTQGGSFAGEGSVCYVGSPTNPVTCCPANFDETDGVGVPDIFAFLSAWFANDEHADFDGIDGVGVPDIFAFLSAWFAGCS